MIHERQKREGWGAKVIPQLSCDIRNEVPEIKGFSERNLKRMIAFYREYSEAGTIVPQAVAKLEAVAPGKKAPQPVAKIESTRNPK